MSIKAICKRAAGLDVHKKIIVASVVLEDVDGQLHEETREFGTLPKDLNLLQKWLSECQIDNIAIESTGIYWVRHEVAMQTVAAESHLHATYCSVSSSLPGHAIGVI